MPRHDALPTLSRSEWRAVSIAFHDAAKSGCDSCGSGPIRRRLRRLYTWMTGNEPATRLADPRLEALRSFVCDVRRHHRVPESAVPMLERLGFNPAQIEALALLSA